MPLVASSRLLAAAATGLLIATLIASPSVNALLLGDAVVRSAPGAPLRAVIPLKPAAGEALEAACFRLIPTAGAGPSALTAKVSVERAAATPRLIITTQDPISEPVVRFAVEAGCDASMRRNYVLALDPRGAGGARTATIATADDAREPRQERETSPAAGPRSDAAALQTAGAAVSATTEIVQPEGHSSPPRAASATASGRAAAATPPRRSPIAEGSDRLRWYLGPPLAMGTIALAILLVTRRRSAPGLPDWTRGGEYSGPRSRTDMSAHPATLSPDDMTPAPRIVKPRAEDASLRTRAPVTAANSLRRSPPHDVSTLDTLIDDVAEADLREERAVRDAWAAARDAVERHDGEENAILRAIDAVEREMLYLPPSGAEAAMDRALEEDLTQPRRPDKAAA